MDTKKENAQLKHVNFYLKVSLSRQSANHHNANIEDQDQTVGELSTFLQRLGIYGNLLTITINDIDQAKTAPRNSRIAFSDDHMIQQELMDALTTLLRNARPEALLEVHGGSAPALSGHYAQPMQSQASTSDRTAIPRSHLSPRQEQVYDLLCRGLSNKLIAHELSMSEGTVKIHVRQIMQKLGVKNRTQAARLAFLSETRGLSSSQG